MKTLMRRFRGTLGYALVWAAAWFAASVVLVVGLCLFGDHKWQTFVRDLVKLSSEMAAIGFITGATFSLYLAGAYRHERLDDLSPLQFTLGAGLVTLLVSIAVIGGITVYQGWGWETFRLDKLFVPILLPAAILGGITGFGSLKLAKRAQRRVPAKKRHSTTLAPSIDPVRLGPRVEPRSAGVSPQSARQRPEGKAGDPLGRERRQPPAPSATSKLKSPRFPATGTTATGRSKIKRPTSQRSPATRSPATEQSKSKKKKAPEQ